MDIYFGKSAFNPKENDINLEDSRTLRNVIRNMK